MHSQLLLNAFIQQKSSTIISTLQAHPELINTLLPSGKSPLHLAVEMRDLELIKALISIPGINLNIKANIPNSKFDGMTPVFITSYSSASAKILKYLIEKGADTSIPTANGQTPLTAATFCNLTKHAHILIEAKNTNVNSVISNGYTALMNAVLKADSSLVKWVTRIPGNQTINNKTSKGDFALSFAVEEGNIEKVKALLAMPDIDLEMKRTPKDDKTALQIAEERSDEEIICLIKEKKILNELSKKIDIRQLAYDPLVDPWFLFEEKLEFKSVSLTFPSYTHYVSTQKKIANEAVFLEYLEQIHALVFSKNKSQSPITKLEKEQVQVRQVWSEVVSNIDKVNTSYKIKHNIEDEVIHRLKKRGYLEDTKRIYQDCIEFLKFNSVIVMSFNAKFLGQGLMDYRTLNLFEKKSDKRNEEYKLNRDETEKELFQWVSSPLKKKMIDTLPARPRYAALWLLDDKGIAPVINYGHSFIVLTNRVKLNSLFNPSDSMDAKYTYQESFVPNTFFHFELLLYQATDAFLASIAKRVTMGTLSDEHTQQYTKMISDHRGYMEAMLPPTIDLLDSAFIKHIHIDLKEYKLTRAEREIITKRGIIVTNSENNPYPKLCTDFFELLQKNDTERVKKILNLYPSLLFISNSLGQEPIHIAAQCGYVELVKILIDHGANLNKRDSSGKAPLHIAIEKGNLKLLKTLTAVKDVDLNISAYMPGTTSDKMTPVFMASYMNSNVAFLQHLIEKGANTSLATTNGQTPLTVACHNNLPERVKLLVETKNVNVNSVITGGYTALINAVKKADAELVESIVTISGNTTINNKADNGEFALSIAVEQKKLDKVKILLSVPGIDLEAKRIPGDGKTALEIAQEKKDSAIVEAIENAKQEQIKHQYLFLLLTKKNQLQNSELLLEKLKMTISKLQKETDSFKKDKILMGFLAKESAFLKERSRSHFFLKLLSRSQFEILDNIILKYSKFLQKEKESQPFDRADCMLHYESFLLGDSMRPSRPHLTQM